ncbi:MAG: TadE/TadG family type IV pilus assembly protein [Candidatus Binatia bacterium]
MQPAFGRRGIEMVRYGRSGQRGVSAVEFALVLPVLCVVLFGVIEFGMAFWRKQILTAAVREGARQGILATPVKTCNEITNTVKTYLANSGFDSSKAAVTPTGCPRTEGTPLTVAATYPSSFFVLSKFSQTPVNADGDLLLDASITMQGQAD